MFIHENRNNQLDDLLNRIGEKLQLTPSMQSLALEKYNEIYALLKKSSDFEGSIYPQGSYALQTTVKPIGRDDFDLDAVLQFDKFWNESLDPNNFLENVCREVEKHYKFVEKKNRCVRVSFKGFHLDIVPALPYDKDDLKRIMVSNIKTKSWKESCPKGYIEWFELQCKGKEVFLEKCVAHSLTQEELTNQLPYAYKPPLKIAVQLAKRYRDVYFSTNQDSAPSSIVITTLFGMFYNKEHSEFLSIKNILKAILDQINTTTGILVLRNPSNADEIITECWVNDATKYKKFCNFIKSFAQLWSDLEIEKDLSKIKEILNKMFAENIADVVILEQAKYVASERIKENLAISSVGTLSQPSVNNIPVKRNNFYGD